MIGGALKKFGKKNGFTIERGMAYGEIGGYTFTLTEGTGFKSVVVAARIEDAERHRDFMYGLESKKAEYKIQGVETAESFLTVVFTDTFGTMKRIEDFISNYLVPKLRENGANGAHTCLLCSQSVGSAGVYVGFSQGAGRVHGSCVDREREKNATEAAAMPQKKNTGRGAIGALIGGVIGTIPWIIAYYFGWFVAWLGLLISLAASKGYSMFGGKPSKAKVWIIVLVVIFCVFFSVFASEAVSITMMVANGELNITYAQVPLLTLAILLLPEYASAVILDLVLGFLFAGLGCASMIRQLRNEALEANGPRYVPLKRTFM